MHRILQQVVAHDLYNAALHEAGHYLVARHLQVGAKASIWPTGHMPTRRRSAFVGVTRLGPLSLYARAVISWAGVLAEWFMDKPQDFPLSDISSPGALTFYLLALNRMERKFIEAYSAPLDTARVAVEVLNKQCDNLYAEARTLIYDCANNQAKRLALRDSRRQCRDGKPAPGWLLTPRAMASIIKTVYPTPDGSPKTDWPSRDLAWPLSEARP